VSTVQLTSRIALLGQCVGSGFCVNYREGQHSFHRSNSSCWEVNLQNNLIQLRLPYLYLNPLGQSLVLWEDFDLGFDGSGNLNVDFVRCRAGSLLKLVNNSNYISFFGLDSTFNLTGDWIVTKEGRILCPKEQVQVVFNSKFKEAYLKLPDATVSEYLLQNLNLDLGTKAKIERGEIKKLWHVDYWLGNTRVFYQQRSALGFEADYWYIALNAIDESCQLGEEQ